MKEINIFEVGGFKIGHAQDKDAMTGCTIFLPDDCAPAGIDIRGGGPASREIHLLDPLMAATGIHGILLSGGSAFGLDAAGGVMEYLEERNIGFDVGVTKVPLVCQSSLFDLMIGSSTSRPTKAMAYEACLNATNLKIESGSIGAGTGCTIGKILGPEYAMKSGIAYHAYQVGNIKVGAIVALNALGDVYDSQTGQQVAGLQNETKNGLRSSEDVLFEMMENPTNLFNGNTTLGIIVTNCYFSKAELCKLAGMTQNAYARAIKPVHTTADGDSIYAVSTGKQIGDINAVGSLAIKAMEAAILKAAKG